MGEPINISNSEGYRSTDPFLLADPAGMVHLFWSERLTGTPGDTGSAGDTIMYATWNGQIWSEPIDILISPRGGSHDQAMQPRAVLDEQGFIHIIWMGLPYAPRYGLYYSSVHAGQASSARAWRTPIALAEDLTGSEASIALAFEPPQTLHVGYARVEQGAAAPEPRAVSYLRSTDGGTTWSDPIDLYTSVDIENGANTVRLLTVHPGKVYLSWSEWNPDGNGRAVYLARSLDSGETWEEPFPVAETGPDEYERDWLNLAVLGENQLVATYEGGKEAYRQFTYSYDGGTTWTEPEDTFYWLIGENGYTEYAYDGADRLHLFLAQRGRVGDHPNRNKGFGLHQSMWQGGRGWSLNNLIISEPMVNPKVVIVNGNQLIATWYSSAIFEIMVATGKIEDAPAVPPEPWPTPPPLPTATASSTSSPTVALTNGATPAVPRPVISADLTSVPLATDTNPGTTLLFGVVPAFIVITTIIAVQRLRRRGR